MNFKLNFLTPSYRWWLNFTWNLRRVSARVHEQVEQPTWAWRHCRWATCWSEWRLRSWWTHQPLQAWMTLEKLNFIQYGTSLHTLKCLRSRRAAQSTSKCNLVHWTATIGQPANGRKQQGLKSNFFINRSFPLSVSTNKLRSPTYTKTYSNAKYNLHD